MPRISIVERDETGAGVYAESTDVVYIPGFVDTLQNSLYNAKGEYVGIEVNTPTLFTSVAQFESLCGTKGAKFETTQSYMDLRKNSAGFSNDAVPYHKIMFNAGMTDPSYIMAKEYLAAGVNVLYERINADPTAVKFTPTVDSYVDNGKRVYELDKPANWTTSYTSYLVPDKSYQPIKDATPPDVWDVVPVNTDLKTLVEVYGINELYWDGGQNGTNTLKSSLEGKPEVKETIYKYATNWEKDDNGKDILNRPNAFNDYYLDAKNDYKDSDNFTLKGYAQGALWTVQEVTADTSNGHLALVIGTKDDSGKKTTPDKIQIKLGSILKDASFYTNSTSKKKYITLTNPTLYKKSDSGEWVASKWSDYFSSSYNDDSISPAPFVFAGDRLEISAKDTTISLSDVRLTFTFGFINDVTTKPLYILKKPYYKMEYASVAADTDLSNILDDAGLPVNLANKGNTWVEGVFYDRVFNETLNRYEYVLVEDVKDRNPKVDAKFSPTGCYYKKYTEITRDTSGNYKALPNGWYELGFTNYFEESDGGTINIPERNIVDGLWEELLKVEAITETDELESSVLPYKITKNDLYALDAGINIVNMYNALGGVYDCGKSDGLLDKGNFSFKYLTSGGYPVYEYNKGSIVAQMIALATERGDCVAIIDHTDNVNREKDINREGSVYKEVVNDQMLKANGDFATMFTPWAEYVRTTTDKSVDERGNKVIETPTATRLPASFAYLMALADSIRTNANWLAIAGSSRGVVLNLATDGMTTNIPNGVADEMQPRDGVAVNAITNIKPYGWTIWGNRTLKNNAEKGNLTATSFLNVRNLISDVKKLVYKVSRQLTFEQNNDILWINFKSLIAPTLERMISGYGISGYKMIKNTTHEKAAEKATLCVDIILYPVYPVEDFYITVILKDDEVTVE